MPSKVRTACQQAKPLLNGFNSSYPSSRTFALTIGVDDEATDCTQAELDADKIDVLFHQYFQADKQSVISLRGRNSTASDVFSAFERIKLDPSVKKGDRFVFYFSGTTYFHESLSQRVLGTWGVLKDNQNSPCVTDGAVAIFLEEIAVQKGCTVVRQATNFGFQLIIEYVLL